MKDRKLEGTSKDLKPGEVLIDLETDGRQKM